MSPSAVPLSCRDAYRLMPWPEFQLLRIDLARHCLAEIPRFGIVGGNDDYDLEWLLAETFIDSLVIRHEANNESFLGVFQQALENEKIALWIERQIVALETFSSHGRAGRYIGRVYFLRGGPFIKIGFTGGEPELRVKELSTGCPYKAVLMGVRQCTRATETWLHQIFREHRANLEWFHATDLIIRTAELLIENDDLGDSIEWLMEHGCDDIPWLRGVA